MTVYLDDRLLAKKLLAGNERAFDRFFDEHYARLYRFALARVAGDGEAAAEIAQSAMSRAIRKLHTYRAESALFTWLCAICRNETSDWLRRQGRYREHIVLTEDYPEVRAAVESVTSPATDDPEYLYQRSEALRLIQVAMDRLPARYGNVLEWKYIEGHSVREIAQRLGVGQEAAQSMLARAKRAFAEAYAPLAGAIRMNSPSLEQP